MFRMVKQCLMAMLLLLGLGATLSAAKPTKDSLKTVKENLKSKKAILLDVRERDEWDDGHLDHAAHLPLSKIEDGITVEELEKLAPNDTIIYLHCAAGARCLQAAERLAKSRRDLRALKPGYQDLLSAGFPKAKD